MALFIFIYPACVLPLIAVALVNQASHEFENKHNTLYVPLATGTAAVATSSTFLAPGLAYLHAQPDASPV